MANNKALKVLCSLPFILFFLYFIPFLGVTLLIVRLFLYKGKKNVPTILIVLGTVILIPSLIESFCKLIKYDIKSIPLLYDIVYFDVYNGTLVSYGKRLLTVGIIFLILSYIAGMVFRSLESKVIDYIKNQEEMDMKIRKENDLKMQEKREKAKNTKVIRCPYCGADNMLTSNTGKCKYCRRSIESK